MNPWPLTLEPSQRALLLEFERLHEQWRQASAAADAIEHAVALQRAEADRLLEFRLAADQVQKQALQLLRDRPL